MYTRWPVHARCVDELSRTAPLQMQNQEMHSTFRDISLEDASNPVDQGPQCKKINHVAVPYIQGATEPAVCVLSRYDISVAHNPAKTLRTILMRPKDSLEPREKSNVTHGFEFSKNSSDTI